MHTIVKAPVGVRTLPSALTMCSCVFKELLIGARLWVCFRSLCVHVFVHVYVSWSLSPHIVYTVYMHALAELYLHVSAQKLKTATQWLPLQLSIPNTFQFKSFSNAVVYNFNQSLNSPAGFSQLFFKWQNLVHQTDYIPLSFSILPFFFYHLPSIPKPAAIPTVRGFCLTAPNLWNDDRRAGAPYPSVFISLFLPFPSSTATPPLHRLPCARRSCGCGHSDGDECSRSNKGWELPPPESHLGLDLNPPGKSPSMAKTG